MDPIVDSRVASQHRFNAASSTAAPSDFSTQQSAQLKEAPPGFDPAALSSDMGFEEFERKKKALWETARALKMMPDELQFFYDHSYTVEMIPKNPVFRKEMISFLKKNESAPPKWMMASGMFPGSERTDDVDVRRKKLRALYKGAVLFIRKALKRHEEDPERAERTVFWDPVLDVCRAMEIAPSALSRFCKELTGNSLIQVIDSIRAESLRGKLKAGIRSVVIGFDGRGGSDELPHPRPNSPEGREGKGDGFAAGAATEKTTHGACLGTVAEKQVWEVWGAMKAERKWPRFSQNAWANEMGFASYRRLYRACQVIYGMTPHQLELVLIEEVLNEGNDVVIEGKVGMTMGEIDAAIMAFEPYRMEAGVVVGRYGG